MVVTLSVLVECLTVRGLLATRLHSMTSCLEADLVATSSQPLLVLAESIARHRVPAGLDMLFLHSWRNVQLVLFPKANADVS